jgi:hypothetical protein
MVDVSVIEDFFKELGLAREEDRAKILSQGTIAPIIEEDKKPLKIESDNVTDTSC